MSNGGTGYVWLELQDNDRYETTATRLYGPRGLVSDLTALQGKYSYVNYLTTDPDGRPMFYGSIAITRYIVRSGRRENALAVQPVAARVHPAHIEAPLCGKHMVGQGIQTVGIVPGAAGKSLQHHLAVCIQHIAYAAVGAALAVLSET